MRTGSGKRRLPRSVFTDLMIFKNRWWQHLIFWVAALLILLNLFKSTGSVERIDLVYTCIFLAPIIGAVYLNLYLAIPRFLRRENYLLFALCFLVLLGGGSLFLYFLFDSWIDIILPDFYFISYYSVPILMLYTGSFLVLTTLLKLSRSWFMLLRVERMTSTHRLQALQAQINPHFLLNGLQTIYALSLEKSEETPGVILQLSQILKYTLYETGHPTVKLQREIEMIRDYVEIYRHRLDPAQMEINLDIKGEPGELLIAPMLLIPFVENSFKHGLPGKLEKAFVNIRIKTTGSRLDFRIRNSHGGGGRPDLEQPEPEQPEGIGVENTRQRLELLYPDKYRLNIEILEDVFEVNLNIELNH